MLKTMQRIVGGVLLIFIAACSSDDSKETKNNPDDSDNTETAWLVRENLSDNDFKPADIEAAVNDLVDALNAHDQDSTMKLGVIPKDLTGYFVTAVAGANDAFTELGVIKSVVAPSADMDAEKQRDQQIEYIEGQVDDGFTGIGLASMAVGVVPAIDAAVDAGLTVVTFDSDEPTSKRQLYVGTINAEAGKTAGHTMADLIDAGEGTVVILGNTDPDWKDGYDRTNEAGAVLEAAGYTVVIQHTNWEDQDENEAALQDIMENGDSAVVGCLGVFSNAYLCATAAEKAGIVDDIKVAAFDFEPQTLELMQDGKIDVTHVQRQYYMGYVIPYLLYAVNTLGLEKTKDIISDIMVDDERIDTGLDIIPADGIEDYNAFLEMLGVS